MRTENRRIALNVAVTYGRSLVSLVCGLFTSRWVLQALGADDFGIYVVVCSLLAFAGFFGGLLSTSISRHFAYALGQGGEGEARAWFRAAFAIHFVLASVLAAVAWMSGDWLIRQFICLPVGRMAAAQVVYRLSVVGFFVGTVGIPFCAYFTAHQRFAELALFGTLQTVYVLAGAYGLLTYGGDRLIAYATFMCVGTVAVQLIQAGWACWKWRLLDGAGRVTDGGGKAAGILAFAGWNGLGGGGYLVATHGSAFVTNRFFGTAANAAYGVAQQVQYQTEALANALVGAFTPAVTERKGANDEAGMLRLVDSAGFLGTVMLALFAVPLALEMETVLGLWLVRPPEFAGAVCGILLASSVLDKLTMGQHLAIMANGRIARWQAVGGGFLATALPLTLIGVALGADLIAAAAALVVVRIGCLASNLYFGQRVAGVSVSRWLARTLTPSMAVIGLAVLAGFSPRLWMEAGVGRLLATTALTTLVFTGGGLWWKRSM